MPTRGGYLIKRWRLFSLPGLSMNTGGLEKRPLPAFLFHDSCRMPYNLWWQVRMCGSLPEWYVMQRILIIDDEETALDILRQILELEGYEVVEARNGQEGVEIFRKQSFDLVITDLVMPVKDGLKTILELRQTDPAIPVIAISGGGVIDKERYLNVAGYIDHVTTLPKPFNRLELVDAVHRLIKPVAPSNTVPA